MRIGPKGNQTVYFIRYRLFGPGRYDPLFFTNNVGPSRFRETPQAHKVPLPDRGSAPCHDPRLADQPRPVAWPYDTPLPSGLPQLPQLPGQRVANFPGLPGLLGGLPGISPAISATIKVWYKHTATLPPTQPNVGIVYNMQPPGRIGSFLDVLA